MLIHQKAKMSLMNLTSQIYRNTIMNKTLIFSIILLFFASCNESRVLKNQTKIPDNIWYKSNIINNKFIIEDTTCTYSVSLEVRHATYFLYKNLNIIVEMINPIGEIAIVPISIPLRDKEGKFQGDGLGDIWDYETLIFEEFNFPSPGQYNFRIKNNMPENRTMAIMGLGLNVEKEKL